MPTLLPWTTFELGDMDIFWPTLPSFAVYTWYVDDEPESSVVHFWRDEDTGDVQSELLFLGPLAFDAAVAQAKEKSPERNVERIHVKHARRPAKTVTGAKVKSGAKPKRAARPVATVKRGGNATAEPSAKAAAAVSRRKAPARKGSR